MVGVKNKVHFYFLRIIHIVLYIPNDIKYILRWLRSIRFKKKFNPIIQEIPWITFRAKKWLDNYLKPNMSLFEFGCGGSTLYFSKKVKEVVSIEHNKKYYNAIFKIMKQKNISNCDLQLIDVPKLNKSNIDIYNSSAKKYAMSISKFPNGYFDLIFIDGIERNPCIKFAIKKIKQGGFLMLDNSRKEKWQEGVNMLNKYVRVDFLGVGQNHPYVWQTSIWKIK